MLSTEISVHALRKMLVMTKETQRLESAFDVTRPISIPGSLSFAELVMIVIRSCKIYEGCPADVLSTSNAELTGFITVPNAFHKKVCIIAIADCARLNYSKWSLFTEKTRTGTEVIELLWVRDVRVPFESPSESLSSSVVGTSHRCTERHGVKIYGVKITGTAAFIF